LKIIFLLSTWLLLIFRGSRVTFLVRPVGGNSQYRKPRRTPMKKESSSKSKAAPATQVTFPAASPQNLAGYVEYVSGSVVSRTLLDNDSGTLTLFAFDRGQNLSEHTAPFHAFIQVLDGEAEVVIGGKPNQVKAGEMILMPANIPHAVNAVAKFKMMLILFC